MSDFFLNSDYINTIPKDQEPDYPGDLEIEWRLRSLIRWNAMAMVVRANRLNPGIGGHISTYASAATLYETAFQHFFVGHQNTEEAHQVYFQGHASPGIYARAFLEGRLTEKHLQNFRLECRDHPGLSSYPHPYLMPDFWEFPTVSMGLGPIMAIYQARFRKYLAARGLLKENKAKIWAFLGDGEMDEPEAQGALSVAGRENLDNLIFVVNCNLQRLDGPVRGNGKIIQELESLYRGAGWNVIKVVWGSNWDPLLEKDKYGLLVKRMNEVPDGQFQKYVVSSGDFIREDFFGTDPRLKTLVADLSDQELKRLRRGGHDPLKIYAAYHKAVNHQGSPTVVLAKTVKGYGLGESGEGKNITHQQKKLNEEELLEFRSRFGIPLSDEEIIKTPFYKPQESSREMIYLKKQRDSLGSYLPLRSYDKKTLPLPKEGFFDEFYEGSSDRDVATTMAFVRLLSKLLKDENLGERLVPIIPDEARTFGMESLFRQHGIYSSKGQVYDPVDADSVLYYKEAHDGKILEEGITEAGAMSSFIAAASSYAQQNLPMVPFYTFYSMFGFQRIGDLAWAASDMRCRGFLCGATAGRTTLAGEGLQHQDGHSHVLAHTIPNLKSYDPAFAYEIAVIVKDGLERMLQKDEDLIYYLTLENEPYLMPKMPAGVEDGILKGLYKFKSSNLDKDFKISLVGSGALVQECLKAKEILESEHSIPCDIFSLTSYKELFNDAINITEWNRENPDQPVKTPYVSQCLNQKTNSIIFVSDYMKILPYSLAAWIDRPLVALGTDGFGRSETRAKLREFFKVDTKSIINSALSLRKRNS